LWISGQNVGLFGELLPLGRAIVDIDAVAEAKLNRREACAASGNFTRQASTL